MEAEEHLTDQDPSSLPRAGSVIGLTWASMVAWIACSFQTRPTKSPQRFPCALASV